MSWVSRSCRGFPRPDRRSERVSLASRATLEPSQTLFKWKTNGSVQKPGDTLCSAADLPLAVPRSDDGEVSIRPGRQAVPGTEHTGTGAAVTCAAAETCGQAGAELFLSVAAVARQLGVAPATLRTWDRRYGLGPAAHVPGAHRRYGAGDIARLEAMQYALLRGASPADAARYALSAVPRSSSPAPPSVAPEPATRQAESTELPPLATELPTASRGSPTASEESPAPAEEPFTPLRPVRVAGHPLRLSGSGALAHGLARAAVALDAVAVRDLLDESLAADGVIGAWDRIVRPVLSAIAIGWEHTGAGVEIEHLLTDGVLGALRHAQCGVPLPGRQRPVLLACVPEELHSLPLYALAAALAHRGVRCRVLGAALPADALTAAVRRTAPAVVFLWAQAACYAAPELLGGLPQIRPRVRVFVGGPGWAEVRLPVAAELLDTLAVATDRIAAAVSNRLQRTAGYYSK